VTLTADDTDNPGSGFIREIRLAIPNPRSNMAAVTLTHLSKGFKEGLLSEPDSVSER